MNREDQEPTQDNDNDNEDKLQQAIVSEYPSTVAALSEDIEKKQINALIQNNDELIQTYKVQLHRQADFAFKAEENRHQEVMIREKNTLEIETKKVEIQKQKVQNQKHSQNTIRMIIGSILSIVIGGYIFAGVTKDSSFPKDILNIIMGGLGGAGGLTLLQKQNKDNPPKE